MKLKHTISNVIILAVLLGQINMPLFIHFCAINQTVSFLSSCGMHDQKPEPQSCCKKEKKSSNTITTVDDQCEVLFENENSTDGIIQLAFEENLYPQNPQNIHTQIPTNQPLITYTNTFVILLVNNSPPESPPIFLLDSNFRI